MDKTIKDVKAKYTETLMAFPGVVSVGIGLNDAGEPAIHLGLDGTNPETESRLPKTLEGHDVVITITGTFRPQK
jgi:hypothetical protein